MDLGFKPLSIDQLPKLIHAVRWQHSAVSLFGEIAFSVSNLLLISLNCWKPISDTELKSVSFYVCIKLPCKSYPECPLFFFF